jgi:uncharacterized protein YjeT (DUF2065 family)
MRNLLLISTGLIVGGFIILNGLLLAIWPKHFLRFYDFWTPGDYVAKTASWRKDVHKLEARLFGLVLVAIGVASAWAVLHDIL